MAEYFIEAGMDVIAVVDPLISQISTDHFEEFMLRAVYDRSVRPHSSEKGAYSSFFVCGDATRNIEVMCKTGCDSISVDENVNFKHRQGDLRQVQRSFRRQHPADHHHASRHPDGQHEVLRGPDRQHSKTRTV